MTEPVPRSLHEHDFLRLVEKVDALDRTLSERISAVDLRHTELAQERNRALNEVATERNRAIDAALTAAKEKAAVHNDLLNSMKEERATFLTKEQAASNFRALAVALGALASIFAIFGVLRVLTT